MYLHINGTGASRSTEPGLRSAGDGLAQGNLPEEMLWVKERWTRLLTQP
jgi:hypothetical protein